MKISKRIKEIKSKVDLQKIYNVEEAVNILKDNSKVKFDETLEVAVKLGVDPKYSDQMVRGFVNLPNGTGKVVRVAVFAKESKAEEAKLAGADIVGADDLVEKINAGEINFDRCIATPDVMALVGRVAKILGPKGLMPNPKLGTVTVNIKEAIASIKAGQVEFRVEKNGIVHAGLGKISFTKEALVANIKAFFDKLSKSRPQGAKGVFIVRASLTSTMNVGLNLDLSTVL